MTIAWVKTDPQAKYWTPAGTGWQTYAILTNQSVPANAVALISCCNGNDATDVDLGVRTPSGLSTRHLLTHEAEGGGETTATMLVQVDGSGNIDTYCDTTTGVTFRVLGYLTGATFTELFDKTITYSSGFNNYKSVEVGLVNQILCANPQAGTIFIAGISADGVVRLLDSLDEAEGGTGATNSFSMLVKGPDSGSIQVYGPYMEYYNLGYFDSTVDFHAVWIEQTDIQSEKSDGTWINKYFPSAIYQQPSWNIDYHAFSASVTRIAERITSATGHFAAFGVYIRSISGSPTGNLYARVRDVSTDTVLAEGYIDISTVSVGLLAIDYDEPVDLSADDVYFSLEYDNADAGNSLSIYQAGSNLFAGGSGYLYNGSWSEYNSLYDLAFYCLHSPSNGIQEYILAHDDGGAETICGVRPDGSSQSDYEDLHEAEGGGLNAIQMLCVPNKNSNGLHTIELICGDNSESKFYYSGYLIEAPAGGTAVPVSDTGGGSDSLSLSAAIPAAETGSDSEVVSSQANLPVSDASATITIINDLQLALWLKMDEVSGTLVYDSSFTLNHGVNYNAGIVSGLHSRNALDFDGTTAYVQIADDPTLAIETNNKFSVAVWVKLDSYNNNVLPRFWEKRSIYGCFMGDSGNGRYRNVALEASNESSQVVEYWGDTLLDINTLYHIAWVFDEGVCQIYINGSAETMTTIGTWSGNLQSTTGYDLYLARRRTDLLRNLDGKMDEVVVAPGKAWTADEVNQLYNSADLNSEDLSIILPLSEIGEGNEAFNEMELPLEDAGTDSEATSSSADIPVEETGGGDESAEMSATIPVSELGEGSDSPDLQANVPADETGEGTESLLIDAVIPLSEAGGSSELAALLATLPLEDTGAGFDEVDVQAEAYQLALDDYAAGADTAIVQAIVALDESGGGIDTGGMSAAIPFTETGGGSDSQSLEANIPVIETGDGLDESSLQAAIPVDEIGTDSESFSASAAVPVADAGVGTDTVVAQILLSLIESGYGQDAVDIAVAIYYLYMDDYGAGSETTILNNLIPISDTGEGTESYSAQIALMLQDLGVGIDTLENIQTALFLLEEGSGLDLVSVGLLISLYDEGLGEEFQSIAAALQLDESGAGQETTEITASIPVVDAGGGIDTLLLEAIITIAETGSGIDVLSALAAGNAFDVFDTSSSVDALSNIMIPLSDDSEGIDTLQLQAVMMLVDLGVAIDSTSINTAMSLLETGSSEDALALLAIIALQDTGSATDVVSWVINIFANDLGYSTDEMTLSAALLLDDIATGYDTSTIQVLLEILETGSGLDEATVYNLLDNLEAIIELRLAGKQATLNLAGKSSDVELTIKQQEILVAVKEKIINLQNKIVSTRTSNVPLEGGS